MALPSFITARNFAEEDIQQVYEVHILGKTVETTVARHPIIVALWMTPLRNGYIHRYIGIELEFDNTFRRIATVQLFDGERCLVIQILDWPFLDHSVEELLNDHRNLFVGTQVLFKLRRLIREFNMNVINLMCRELPYRFRGFRVAGSMVGILNLLGLMVAESDWARRNSLSSQQVHYACARAFLNIHMLNLL